MKIETRDHSEGQTSLSPFPERVGLEVRRVTDKVEKGFVSDIGSFKTASGEIVDDDGPFH